MQRYIAQSFDITNVHKGP